jgi:uncharacterized membrane protein HdeD (DUF308 family)
MTNDHASPGLMPGLPGSLLTAIADHWWVLLLRGIAAIIFGILAIIWPGVTLLSLTLLWGAFTLVDGVAALYTAAFGKSGAASSRWWLAIVGVVGIIAAGIAFLYPGMTALVLLWFIASWAIVIGVMQVIGAIQLRKEIEGEWLLALNGILSIAFGLLLFIRPGEGALAVIWLIGVYAIAIGILLAVLAFRVKAHKQTA